MCASEPDVGGQRSAIFLLRRQNRRTISRMSALENPVASLHLTKSRYIAGLQCPRRLWLVVHEPLPYEEALPGSPLDMGQEIGIKAHLLFPGRGSGHRGTLAAHGSGREHSGVDERYRRSRDLRGCVRI